MVLVPPRARPWGMVSSLLSSSACYLSVPPGRHIPFEDYMAYPILLSDDLPEERS